MTRLKTIEKWDKKILEFEDVIERLNCSSSTAYRYLARYRRDWPPGLIHWLRGRPSNNKGGKLDWIKKYALKKKYRDFWPTLLQECLIEELWRDEVAINVETLRLKMIERWTWVPKKINKEVRRHKRERRAKKWMMSQFDWSYHIWLEDWKEVCFLLAVDDATWELLHGRFTQWEW